MKASIPSDRRPAAVQRGSFDATNDAKTVVLPAPVRARFFKLVALSTHTRHTSLAELTLLEAQE